MVTVSDSNPSIHETLAPLRLLADQAFSRAAGAPLVSGNEIRLLRDAVENYPAWLEAIRSAKRMIHFETYSIHADKVGNEFVDLLARKAREGIRVRLIYHWFGARGAASWFFWRRLRKAGVEVRCFNPPRLDSPLGWLSRDHRKLIAVDGRIGFVSGLCVGQSWVGDRTRHIEPWRDTGVQIEGPAVLDLERAFAQMWNSLGPANSLDDALTETVSSRFAGNGALRIVAGQPQHGWFVPSRSSRCSGRTLLDLAYRCVFSWHTFLRPVFARSGARRRGRAAAPTENQRYSCSAQPVTCGISGVVGIRGTAF
jgi:cardiolipin synthase